MATALTDAQLQTLITALTTNNNAAPAPPAPAQVRNDAAALGPMPPCTLGSNKMTRLQQFETWLEEAENRMHFIGVTEDEKKVRLLRSWGGPDLVKFMKTHANVLFEATPATATAEAIPADNYTQSVTKIKTELRQLVNKTMAMHQLMTTDQGDRNWMDFIKDLEDKAHILDFNSNPYQENDAVKDAAIFGMADGKLREKALAEDPDLPTLIRWGQSREAGKEGATDLRGNPNVQRVSGHEEFSGDQNVRKVHSKPGRYSNKFKPQTPRNNRRLSCNNCSSLHAEGRCPAKGRECHDCGELNHFARSRTCPNRPQQPVRRVEDDRPRPSNETDVKYWPGVNSHCTNNCIKLISTVSKLNSTPQRESKKVPVHIGGVREELYADTGSKYTIIPPSSYRTQMGPVEAADTHLRAWGAKGNLDVKGMVRSTIETEKGARTTSNIYIVDGFHPEPLLGDQDAEDLGFITFNREGRDPRRDENNPSSPVQRIAQKLRDSLQVDVETSGHLAEEIPPEEREKVENLIDRYSGLVFSDDKIGQVKIEPIHLDYDPTFTPTQPPFHNIPIHYQPQLSKLLDFLREQGVITDVDPSETHECVLNTVITDKKNGEIRMNIDATPWNEGMKRTKFHVQTPHEIRHELKKAKVFTEMDMGWAFHQLPIDEATKEKAIFQTHEGLHRMERLYFGPTASSGIFHNEIRKILQGLRGALNIHDNMLVWGITLTEHLENLVAFLERCLEFGIVLKRAKTSICTNSIKWFGRTFSSEGVTADGDKIQSIVSRGKPDCTEDVRSFLMACQYNAKFLFDHPDVSESYEQITAPLRTLLKKDMKFIWTEREDQAYQKLLALMESPATLRPYDPSRPTHFVADSSEVGVQCSIYQEREDNTWVPVDHTSRSLTPAEQDYSPIERESLAQSFGMDQFRFYLVGGQFTAWTDHEPLAPIYNNTQKPATKRIKKHRDQVIDLRYTMRHLPGKDMPCDYGSRNPYPIDNLSEEDKDKLGCDTGKEIYVRRIDIGNTPDAITTSDIKQAGLQDATYLTVMREVKAGLNASAKVPVGYKRVWKELSVIDNLLHKGSKLVLPHAISPGGGSIRTRALDIAHEGHPGIEAMKQLLRARLWFPGMDTAIEESCTSCMPCQASTEVKHRDPLKPATPPENPWEKLATDHWGPTADGKYLLVVIDKLSRYPEVAVVNSTSADDNIEAFDNIFTRHGYCKDLISDGGPPFNGNDTHHLQQYFKWAGINHHPTHSAEDPEANGLAEAFMKHCRKIWHAAIVEGKNPRAEINKHLLMVRSTPHPTTKKSPAEILFGRKITTRLPISNPKTIDRPDIKEAVEADRAAKERQKAHKDDKTYVKHHQITVGDQVLLKQHSRKHVPPYDPHPYTVTEIHGHQITARREDQQKTRDSQKWKRVETRPRTDYRTIRRKTAEIQATGVEDDILDIGMTCHNSHQPPTPTALAPPETVITQGTMIVSEGPQHRPRRTNRRPPPHLEDFVTRR